MKKMLLFAAMLMVGAIAWSAEPRAQVYIISSNAIELSTAGTVRKTQTQKDFRTSAFFPVTAEWSDFSLEITPSTDEKLVISILGESTVKNKIRTSNWVEFDQLKIGKRKVGKTPAAFSGAKYGSLNVRQNAVAGTLVKVTGKIRIATPEAITAGKQRVAARAEAAAAKAKAKDDAAK